MRKNELDKINQYRFNYEEIEDIILKVESELIDRFPLYEDEYNLISGSICHELRKLAKKNYKKGNK